MPAIVHQNAFSLGPGVFKISIDYDEDETDYKYTVNVYGTQRTPEISTKSPPKQKKKPINGDSIVIKLDGERKFQINEIVDDAFTEAGDYGINTVKQSLYFQDPALGWIKVGEMFSSYPMAGTHISPASHDRQHDDTYYGKFIHVKKSEFRSLNTNLKNTDFTNVVPSMKDIASTPIDIITSIAQLDNIMQKHKVKLNALCKCFNDEFATQYLKANTGYRNRAVVQESLKTLNGLSIDDIYSYYEVYAGDIEKLVGDV
jgi:hypothetical protein